MATDDKSGHQLIAVAEALNETLKERYFAGTDLSAENFMKSLTSGQCAAVAHWKPEHAVYVRFINYALRRSELETFIGDCRKSTPRPGWKELIVPEA